MPLRITKASEAISVSTITTCIIAPPGLGKTSMGFTAHKPLLLDFDKGAYRARNRGDTVQVETWGDVSGMGQDDLSPYRTLVVDTAGRALDVLSAQIMKDDPKNKRGESLTLQGFGVLKSRFTAWIKMVRGFGLDVVLLCHADEQKSGDDIIVRLDMQGGSKNEVYKVADMMGSIYMRGGKRMLNFNPTDVAFGKNPRQLPAIEVPDYGGKPDFLAGVISQTKAALNQLSELQTKVAAELTEWRGRIEVAGSPEAFDELVTEVAGASEEVRHQVKLLISQAGKAKGFTYSPTTKKWEGMKVA